jgi:hypothetical protein
MANALQASDDNPLIAAPALRSPYWLAQRGIDTGPAISPQWSAEPGPLAWGATGLAGAPALLLNDAATSLGNAIWDVANTNPIDPATGRFRLQAIEDATNIAGLATASPLAGARGAATLGSGAVRSARVAQAAALPMDEAARLARAQAMGFRSDMPLGFAVAPADEKIATAALNVNGRIYTGPSHMDAMMAAERIEKMPLDEMRQGPILDGFVTNTGRFVSRWEAADIAARAKQGTPSGAFGATRGLASENTKQVAPFTEWATNDAAGQASLARQIQQRSGTPTGPDIAATAPGLPGGHGIWGDLGTAGNPQLWHRTERPAVVDAQGLQDSEIQARLKDAWDRGHDAVMVKNYTRPGGQKPEPVIVVRDPNQIRSPSAAFDPELKTSRNLLAGLAGLVMMPVGAQLLAPVDHDPFQEQGD